MNGIRQFLTMIRTRFRSSHSTGGRVKDVLAGQSPMPKSAQEAHARLHQILHQGTPLQELGHDEFMCGWVAMAYIAPALDPDDAGSEDGGWPLGWSVVAAEAFRRFKAKELTKEELYPRPNYSL